MGILVAISLSHLLNDLMQSVIPSVYPILKQEFTLSFGQVGLIQLAFQLTASILQPMVGIYTDKHPKPFSLPLGMGFTFIGLVSLSLASTYWMLLVAVSLVGIGSSIFHPEASRIARLSSGGRHGLAQSLFQVGGNFGSAIGPLLAAVIVISRGQIGVAWFSLVALVAMMLLTWVGVWYRDHMRKPKAAVSMALPNLPRPVVLRSLSILAGLMFSKFFYMAAFTSYYTFYLMERFAVTVQQSQLLLFVFLAAVAVGTISGGPIGDRVGRKFVLWFSILGALPFTLLLPFMDLSWTIAFSIIIGLILSSAFPAIVVYAQELVPGKIGLVSGIFFGLSFGLGGIGAAFLGELADWTSITFVYRLCAFLPMIGFLIYFLPNTHRLRP
ncbi:FSR family fosmidomycin resistance protein-like MFS transporter [Rhodoligotrophos appendicifer]|uniref:MFS transporter n=1 Tax=Rhodoligotrophos appendicifer TaxID=987056 RepID=UPI00118636F5|nr:MFS transporter [Rhodoligotrophos appendicifer]